MKLGALVLVAASAVWVTTQLADKESHPACIKVSTSAPYSAFAYKHIVTVKNACRDRKVCWVSTDVDPQPEHRVALDPDDQKDVVTRSNSPAREFKAKVRCP